MQRFGIAGVLVALLALSAAGQDAVEIKIAYPKAGDRVRVTVEAKSESTKTVTAGGKTTEGKPAAETRSLVYVDDVLENPNNAKRPTKLKRTYEKAVVAAGGKETTLPVEGKTVLVEKKGDAYSFTVDGKAVDAESLKVLQGEFGRSDIDTRSLLLPAGKVKPGDTWKADAEKLAKALGESFREFTLDPQKTKAGGTLVKTSTRDGRRFGVIELKVEGPLVAARPNDKVKIKDGKLTVAVTGSGCIDGSVPIGDSRTAMRLALTATGEGFEVSTEFNTTESRKMELLPKK